ncbi:MAG: hypothetical protein K2Q26_00790, partial [Bdellovibrionales bacterium]|nr:hypothetical protein [Bdellovibrionales bacterium]
RIEMPWFRRHRPLLIGLAGNSGAGKNRLASTLYDLFGKNATSLIEGDDYHKWERGNEKWQDYTHLNPRANYLETLSQHILMLLQGQPVFKSQYDHSSGQFTDERFVTAKKNIIVQGLHTFYPIVLRQIMDIKIFVAPHEQLRTYWKIKRDVSERGHVLEKVVSSIKARQKDSKNHIDPQQRFSHWTLAYTPYSTDLVDLESPKVFIHADLAKNPDTFQVHHIINDTPIDNLVEELRKLKTLKVLCEPDLNNLDFLKLEIHGTITVEEVGAIAERAFGNIRHLTRSDNTPIWESGYDGINQLIFLALIVRSEAKWRNS